MKAITDGYRVHSLERRAFDLLEYLQQTGGVSMRDACKVLCWTESQFRTALDYARAELCPAFDVTIPHPVPNDGFRYHLTGAWVNVDGTPAIEAGTSYALGKVEAQLRGIHRDIKIAKKNLTNSNSIYGQKVRYLDAHLSRIFGVLERIGSSVPPSHDEGVA